MNIAEAMKPPKPANPCYACGSTEYWYREKGWGEGAWLCKKCHPPINGAMP
jgi:hypothetical protein